MSHADEARRAYNDARNAPNDDIQRGHALTSIAASLIRLGDLLDNSNAEVMSARSRIHAASEHIHDPFSPPATGPVVALDREWWEQRRREAEGARAGLPIPTHLHGQRQTMTAETERVDEATRRRLWAEANGVRPGSILMEEHPNDLDDPEVH